MDLKKNLQEAGVKTARESLKQYAPKIYGSGFVKQTLATKLKANTNRSPGIESIPQGKYRKGM